MPPNIFPLDEKMYSCVVTSGALLNSNPNNFAPKIKPTIPLKIRSIKDAALPTTIVSSEGCNKPDFSLRFNSALSTSAAATKASATIKPKVFNILRPFH